MNKINIKIKTSISILFTSIILAVVGIIMFFQYKSNTEFASLTTQKAFTIISDNVVNKINAYDEESRQFLNLLNKMENVDEIPAINREHAILPVMIEHIKNSNYIYATYIGFKDSTFYEIINLNLSASIKKDLNVVNNARWLIVKHLEKDGRMIRYEKILDSSLKMISLQEYDTSYNCSQRPWYKQAMGTNKSIKTDPYFFSTLKQFGVTYSKTINKKTGTVLALDISLKSLNTLLKKQNLVKGSASFIFTKNGEVIGGYDDIKKKNIKKLYSEYPNIFTKNEKILDLNKQVIIKINDIKYIKYTTLLKSKFNEESYLTIISPYETIMKPYTRKIYEAIAITLLVLVLLIFPIVFYAIDLIVSPILNLEKENDKISKGKFKEVKKVPSFMIEISSLSESLVDMSESIDDLTSNLEKKIIARTKEVEEKNKNIATLLNNAGQGFLYFNREMIVGSELSKETTRIFDKNIVGENIISLLFDKKDEVELITSTLLYILDEEEDKREILISLLKKEFKINNQFIELEYKVLNKDSFMLILTDITARKDLDQQIKDEQQVLKMVVETVSSIDQFKELKSDYEKMILNINDLKTLDNLATLRMEIHTYKGLFAQKKMLNIVKELHTFESLIDESLKSKKLCLEIEEITTEQMQSWLDSDIKILTDILGNGYFNSQKRITIKKERISTIAKEMIVIKNKINEHLKKDNHSEELLKSFEKLVFSVKSLENRNIFVYLNPYRSLVEDLAMSLEKPLNSLLINCEEDIFLDDKYKGFLTSLVHIFRNSVDHGIETIERREELEKELFGTISVDIKKEDKKLFLNISDDGKGIDLEFIKELAVKREIYTKDEAAALSEQEALLIVFKDEFSTSSNITDISGRGVGLASILYELNKLKGYLHIQNELGKGITFNFTLDLDI